MSAGCRAAQLGLAEPHGVERADAKVLHEHVGLRDEPREQRATLRPLEVERHALLVAIDAEEIGALAG